jgi:hypothetical protein
MVSDVVIGISGDASQYNAELEAAKAKKDALVREWKIDRNTLLRQVREGFTMISSLMSSFRQAMSIFGQQIDPFFSALIGMVLATASMLISAATVLAMTGIGGVAAALIFGLAVGFQILTIEKLLVDKAATDDWMGQIQRELRRLQENRGPQRTPIGGGLSG